MGAQIRIYAWGKLHTPGLTEAAEHYELRIQPWCRLETIQLRSANDATRDSQALRERLSPRDRLIFLSEHGRSWSTEEWAQALGTSRDRAQAIAIAIGPANGLKADVLRPNDIVSFGRATLAHELAQVVLLEQLYRAYSVLAGHPYHRP